MRKLPAGALTLPLWVYACLMLAGCGENNMGPPPSPKATTTPGPFYVAPLEAQSNPQIKEIMEKVGGRDPKGLQETLGAALKQPELTWNTIQGEAKEYADLTSKLGKLDPVKGDKDTWSKKALAFAETAAGLDKSAQAKDKDQTKEALDALGNSCMACHREHRVMRPGGGRPGMGGPPPGGPPPGGPGGPPPGGRGGPPPG